MEIESGVCRIGQATVAVVAAICAISLHGQQPQIRFEVASVRPNHALACNGRWDFSQSHGRLNVENVSLRKIISRAYSLAEDRVSGPAWIESECYDIVAKAPADAPDEALMPMLQVLLRDRFDLVTHQETAEMPIFALVVDRNGPKVHEYHPGDSPSVPSSIKPGKVFFMVGGPMSALTERLSLIVGRTVVDKTGLQGEYRIPLSYAPLSAASAVDMADTGSDIFSAVREQLGLRLDAQKGNVEILKIDRANKVPVEN